MAAAGVRAQYGQMQNAAGANVIQPGRGPNAAGAPPIQQRGAAGAPGPGAPGQWERDQGSMGRGAYRGSHEGAWEQSRVTLPSEMRGPTLDPKDAALMGKGAGVGVPGTPRGLQNPLNKTFPAGDPNAPPGAPSAPRASITGLQTPYQATPLPMAEQQTQGKQGAAAESAGSQITSTAHGLTQGDPGVTGASGSEPGSELYLNAASDEELQAIIDQEGINSEAGRAAMQELVRRNQGGQQGDAQSTRSSTAAPGDPATTAEQDAATQNVRQEIADANGVDVATINTLYAQGYTVSGSTIYDRNGNAVGDLKDPMNAVVMGATKRGEREAKAKADADAAAKESAGNAQIQALIAQLLGGRPPAGMDRAGLDAMKRSNEAQFASEAAKAMRAGLVASARSGMSPEAQSGMIADVGERGGLAAQAANAQAELQFAAQQAQQNLAYYQQQQEALKFAISLAQDDKTRAALMRQQMLMAQYEKQANMDLMKYQAELNKPEWYDYLLGGIGTAVGAAGTVVGGLASGGYLGKPKWR